MCYAWVALCCPELHWTYCSDLEQVLWSWGMEWMKMLKSGRCGPLVAHHHYKSTWRSNQKENIKLKLTLRLNFFQSQMMTRAMELDRKPLLCAFPQHPLRALRRDLTTKSLPTFRRQCHSIVRLIQPRVDEWLHCMRQTIRACVQFLMEIFQQIKRAIRVKGQSEVGIGAWISCRLHLKSVFFVICDCSLNSWINQ